MNFTINPAAKKTSKEMLFLWVEQQIQNHCAEKKITKKELINLGIGDTSHVLPLFIKNAIVDATNEMTQSPIGYGDETGRLFLKDAIANQKAYQSFQPEEIFVTEGIANSLSHLIGLFGKGAKIGVLRPCYPVYISLLKHTELEIVFIDADKDHSFSPPKERLDGIILCSPNNPTSLAFSKQCLKKWIDWACNSNCIILFDAAYNSFILDNCYPNSIYEIPGAKKVAIEMKSFSKSHGFSGLRLGYFLFPKEISYQNISLLPFCKNLIASKTNGVSFPIQKAGVAALSKEGLAFSEKCCKLYLNRTQILKKHLEKNGHTVIGGQCAPYLFLKTETDAKHTFEKLLFEKNIITIPGQGFGAKNFLRISGFISENTLKRSLKHFFI